MINFKKILPALLVTFTAGCQFSAPTSFPVIFNNPFSAYNESSIKDVEADDSIWEDTYNQFVTGQVSCISVLKEGTLKLAKDQNNKYFVEDEAYRKLLIQVLSFMQKKQLLLEVNLGGIKATGQLVPRGWIIKEAIKLNIPITIGSDIHNCDEISNEVWKFAIKNLKKVGLKTIAVPIITN